MTYHDLCWQLAEPPVTRTAARRARRGGQSTAVPASREVIDACRQAFAERFSGHAITDQQAAAVAARIIGSQIVRRPANYVAAAIKRDVDPFRLLPGGKAGTAEDAALLGWLRETAP